MSQYYSLQSEAGEIVLNCGEQTNMTQLLRGMLTIGIIAILVFLIVLLYMDLDQPAVEKEECPFAQQDYIYWSKKYKLAWCKVVFPRPNFSKKNQTSA